MDFLTQDEKRTLALLCDTLVPPLPPDGREDPRLFLPGASSLQIPEELERYVGTCAPPARRRRFRQLLRLVDRAWFNGLTGGVWLPVSQMSLRQRTALLAAWRDSRWSILRRAFHVLKRPTLFLFYSSARDRAGLEGELSCGSGQDENGSVGAATLRTLPASGARHGSNGAAGAPCFERDGDVPRNRLQPVALGCNRNAATTNRDGGNPTWPVFRYRAPAAWRAQTERGRAKANGRLQTFAVGGKAVLATEVLVIGSGAGGGVVAAELAARGHDVLVLEKGDYFADADFRPSERFGVSRMYEGQGWLATDDLSIGILAGSTVGGGTTVNWMTCLAPPEYVLEEWRRDYGFEGATSSELQVSLRAVSERLGVTADDTVSNRHNGVLEAGCRALGYHVATSPRNAQACRTCGFCSWGCALGTKQDARKTYLQDACDCGARLLPRAEVRRILHYGGHVSGADIIVTGDDGAKYEMTLRARVVVVTAGALHTPALLLRSGLGNRNIGAGLRLHPTAAVFGRYREPVYSWRGPLQTRYCEEFADLDGRGHGVRLEVCPAHPGLWALALPWASGREHKRLMQHVHRMANIIVLTRDRYGGRVTIDDAGRPVVRYRLHRYDERHLMRGVVEGLRVHVAADAEEVISPQATPMLWSRFRLPGETSKPRNVDIRLPRFRPTGGTYPEFEGYLQAVRRRGAPRNGIGLASAHQLASCRIAGDPRRGAVDPEGQSYDVRNLFVADGSVMPTACGVNPMITIMGLAHYIAQHVKATLGVTQRPVRATAIGQRASVKRRRRQARR